MLAFILNTQNWAKESSLADRTLLPYCVCSNVLVYKDGDLNPY